MLNKECNHPTCGDTCRRIKKPKKRYILKRSPIKKKAKPAHVRKQEKEQQQKDWLFYLQIWEEREHIDFETGEPILSEPLTLFFHHVLPKSEYEEFRHCKWNIVLVNWETHTNADNAMTFTPRIKQYYNYLISHLDEIKDGTYKPSFKKFKTENHETV